MRAGFVALALAMSAAPVLAQPPVRHAPPPASNAKKPAPQAVRTVAAQWRVIPATSTIGFASSVEDTAFRGVFTRWTADIRFDPANLAGSSARVVIDPTSANSGLADRDKTLRETDWFDTQHSPQAVFQTTSIRAVSAGRYEALGTLSIKGRATPVTLPFTVAITGANADMQGALTVDRIRLGLGAQIQTDMVPVNVAVSVRVHASRAP